MFLFITILLFFYETWTSESSVVDVNGFALHRTPPPPQAKRDSGGLIVYYRNTISRGIEIYQKQNDIIGLKLKSDVLKLEHDIYMCLYYILPVNSSRQTFNDTDTFDRIVMIIKVTESAIVYSWVILIAEHVIAMIMC